jgi:hypothetical protein
VDRADPDVRRALIEGIATAVHRADDRLAPARLGAVAIEAPDVTSGRLASSPDPEIVMVKVVSSAGRPIALVWNYAIHGTMLGPRNLAFSGDVMGVASREAEQTLGVPALFVNGAVGDVSPRQHGHPAALAVGRDLAARLVRAWSQIEPSSDGAVHVKSARVELGAPAVSVRSCLGRFVPAALQLPLGTMFPRDAVVTAGTIGPAAWVTIPGELQSSLGRRIKGSVTNARTRAFVAGLSNDYLGYFLEADAYQRASYVTCASLYGPSAGERLTTVASEVLREVVGIQR